MADMHHSSPPRLAQGFTWVELLVTLAILGVLLAMATPGLRAFWVQRAVSTQASALADGLRLARAEAVKRHQKITVCTTANPEATNPTCASASTNWASGWLIFADANGNKVKEAHETLLHLQQGLAPSGGLTLPNNKPAITFSAQGLAVANNASFLVRPPPGDDWNPPDAHHRCVRLAVSGRVRVLPGVC